MEKSKWFKKIDKMVNEVPRFKPLFEYMNFTRIIDNQKERNLLKDKLLLSELMLNLKWVENQNNTKEVAVQYYGWRNQILTRYTYNNDKITNYVKKYNILCKEKPSTYNMLLVLNNRIEKTKNTSCKYNLQILHRYAHACLKY